MTCCFMRRTVPCVVGIVFFALAFVLAMNLGRNLPFGSTDDGPIYFLPLIQAQTDAWLSGHFLSIDWRLGCGWTPWEGIQAGAFYPPYIVANLLSRLIGNPLAILDVSAALHLALTGLLVYVLTVGKLDRPRRMLWALLSMVQPAPIILGMNWHNYLACHPWFIALLLLIWRLARGYSSWTPINRMCLVILFGAFFLAAHPQMFVLGTALLFVWRLALGRDRNCLRDWLAMGSALVALAVPLLLVRHQSLLATPDWFAGRGDKTFMLQHAQSLPAWLFGLTAGNLVPSRLFSLWPGVSWTGIGMFFCPLLLLSAGVAVRRRNWVWLALVAGLGVMLGAGSFPWVAGFGMGPLSGFRWTWKLSLFAAALALAMALSQSETWRIRPRLQIFGLAVLIGLSAAVSLRALPFDLIPAGTCAPGSGIAATCAETRRMMREWGIQANERIAWVGKRSISMPSIAAPLHGLMGNAPLLVGLQSAHLFEPLENHAAARAHDGYSTPWRITLGVEEYASRRGRHNRRFSELGVTWLVSPEPGAFPADQARVFRDVNGGFVYGMQLPPLQKGLAFPWGLTAKGRKVVLVVEPGGALRTGVTLAAPPVVPVGRPLTWKRLPTGHWRGVVHQVDVSWFVAGALGLCLSGLLLGRGRRWEEQWI